MPPIVKIWHCTLKDSQSATSPEFRGLLSEILEMISTYTNPDPASPPMHVFYQDTHNPSHLFMITGYPSQETNTEADAVYAEKFMPRLFQYVDHKWLRQLDLDIKALPLEQNVVLASGTAPEALTGSTPGVGGWDVWPQTTQGQQLLAKAGIDQVEKVWVRVEGWDGHSEDQSQPPAAQKFYLQKFMGR